MSDNSFGKLFRITTFGESHGFGLGVVVDGCPPGLAIDHGVIQTWLERRRPGQSPLTSPRQESDHVEILSGVENNITLGSPIAMLVRNQDAKPAEYHALQDAFRPSHADYTTRAKYGIAAQSGGGRASARETIGRVAAAALAEQVLQKHLPELRIVAYVDSVKDIHMAVVDSEITRAQVEQSLLRCPDPIASRKMQDCIEDAQTKGDSVGGSIVCAIYNCPVGLGAPVFDKLEADLAKAMLSLPASKGFEIGAGFASARMYGSEHNDEFYVDPNQHVRTRTNNSGGIQGGISNGETIYMRIAFKPPATIRRPQQTIDQSGATVTINNPNGRHDPCVLPRAVPMVEAMATLVIVDHWLRQEALGKLV